MALASPVRAALRPVLIASQAIPVFAIAPILVMWMGYGAAPKIVMAAIVIFFPVATAFADGLRRVPPETLDLARAMGGGRPGFRWRLLAHVQVPAALPALATGLRVAAGVAAIAAVIGEWVGASEGLGYLMPWANARSRIDLMFAALAALIALSLAFYLLIDFICRRMTPWAKD